MKVESVNAKKASPPTRFQEWKIENGELKMEMQKLVNTKSKKPSTNPLTNRKTKSESASRYKLTLKHVASRCHYKNLKEMENGELTMDNVKALNI